LSSFSDTVRVPGQRYDLELHHLAGGRGIGGGKIGSGYAAAEGLVGALVDQVELGAGTETGEVHDHIRPLGQGDQQSVELDGRR
jgi:hypothetical protein